MPGFNILVVNDKAEHRNDWAEQMNRLGHHAIPAEDGLEALARVQGPAGSTIDLILLDIEMPRMNGIEVLKRLQDGEKTRNIPVIVLTAYSSNREYKKQCYELGAIDFLDCSTLDPEPLLARIKRSLRVSEMRREERELNDRMKELVTDLADARRKYAEMLHAIIPREVADVLLGGAVPPPRRFDGVAVLFCDIVKFTTYCDLHPPEEVVEHLGRLVAAFERIAKQCKLEKIKTIGDSFMATAGLLLKVDNPVESAVRCGLEMIEAAPLVLPDWKVRVGINFGPVVAGVIGGTKFHFDLWGDTVNLAARMESNGVPGKVCLTSAAWRKIAAFSDGRREEIKIKSIDDRLVDRFTFERFVEPARP